MNDISMIAVLSFATLLPFLIASGTCFVKFSIVLILMRNALGVQQVPSNMTLNGIALMLSAFVMAPVGHQAYTYYKTENVKFDSVEAVEQFIEGGLGGYRNYLQKYADPKVTAFFHDAQNGRLDEPAKLQHEEEVSMLALLPAYALSEIKDAFKMGFYLYLPFIVIDLVISSILLALGMMMMSPVTISVPVKLILFVAMDGWTMLSQGMVMQYVELAR